MTLRLAPLALLAALACTAPPVDDGATAAEAPPGPSSFLPTGRLEIGAPAEAPPSLDPGQTPIDDGADFDGEAARGGGGGKAKCGDGACGRREDCGSCPADCGICPPPPAGPSCGDGTCNGTETCDTCSGDCGACPPPPPDPVCGDLICEGLRGEMCTNCADCATTTAVCGNGACQAGETAANCRPDCGDDPWPQTRADLEAEVVRLMNVARAEGRDCPSGPKDPVGPLTSDALLQQAARLHSWDQSYSGYFAHQSCNGRSPWQRAADVGTSATAETIGWGYQTPQDMVNGWLASTSGHCDILMSTRTFVGVGMASENGRLWTAMFR